VVLGGDLNDWPGRPTHQAVVDGTPIQTGRQVGTSVGFRRDEKGASIGRLPLRISVVNTATMTSKRVSSWNQGEPGADEIAGFSWYGGRYEAPAPNRCTARLGRPAAMRWEPNHVGTARDYLVEAVRCGGQPLTVTGSSKVVLESRMIGDGAKWIKALTVGASIHLGWANGSVGAQDVIAGSALVLQEGVVTFEAGCATDLCRRNPRTAVGVMADGTVMLLVVDGRASGSVGLTLRQLGMELKALGAVDAANLDGGGSATMWIKGMGVVNRPTDSSGERPVSNAIVILPGADAAEPSPAPTP
jgi:hypothetical protein